MISVQPEAAPPTGHRLRVLVLHSSAWQPRFDAYRPGETSDPHGVQRALARRGIDLELIDPGRRPWNPFAGLSPMLEGMDPLRALRIMLRDRRADAILCVNEGAAFPFLLLRWLLGFRVPVLVWDIIFSEVWRLRRRVLDIVIPQADGLLVTSSFQRDHIAQRWSRREGVEVVGHVMDTDFWRPQGAAPPDGPLLTVGNDHSRDFDLLLDAMQDIDADLVVRSARIPADRPLSPRVTIMREKLSEAALRDLYEGCRFVVVPLRPTLNAGGINTIMEAAAMGRAMVVSDSPVIRDFLHHDETCLVVPCGDRTALQAAIRRLLGEPETCARLGQNARRFAEVAASAEACGARLAAALRRHTRGEPI